YEMHLDKNAANYQALTPLSFLRRAAWIYPNRVAVIHGDLRRTWAQVWARSLKLASALSARGIGVGDTVSIVATNTPEMFEAHFGVPMCGAVLNTINTRLDAAAIGFILQHAEAKVLICDTVYAATIRKALAMLEEPPLVIDIDDPMVEGGERLGEMDFEALVASGDEGHSWQPPEDEWQAISLNYTSGTTGNPKGVVYHHRGAYLNAIGEAMAWEMPHHATYLWTLPMFHCNGWCFPWTLAATVGTSVCLRKVEAKAIFQAFADHGVTHLCGAPVVMNMMVNAPASDRVPYGQKVQMMTAGAAPPSAIIRKMEAMGIKVTHVYGLTEVYGPATVCAWKSAWNDRSDEERAALKARQGVPYVVMEDLMVADPESLEPVPRDGETVGEVFFRGNIVMKGYLKNPTATANAFKGGWFHTGDAAVWHEDGYIEIKDRFKDIIISGGENISTLEVESVLYQHDDIQECAVVARPDEKWGETVCAFITLKPEAQATAEAITAFCRMHLAGFKIPRTLVFTELPKTSTGKVQKFVLRERARNL
ncbi:MAG: acyl-CoA synthetase, partial [Myxococcota bacterium]